jgi:protein required for attachment to host cells
MEISTDHRRASEMGPDAPGRSFESVGTARHSVAPRTDPERIEEQRFAGRIVERLDQAAGHSRFDKLILVAPPRMLGDLRAALTPRLASLLSATLARDLTKIPQARLVGHLEEALTK